MKAAFIGVAPAPTLPWLLQRVTNLPWCWTPALAGCIPFLWGTVIQDQTYQAGRGHDLQLSSHGHPPVYSWLSLASVMSTTKATQVGVVPSAW